MPSSPPLGFPRIELVQHSRKYAINYNRAALDTTLPMLIAWPYLKSTIKRIVQKYAVRKFGTAVARRVDSYEEITRRTRLRKCSSPRCDRTNHKL